MGILFAVFGFPAFMLLAYGASNFGDGNIVRGSFLSLLAAIVIVLFFWTLNKLSNITYKYEEADCPEKGKLPRYGYFKSGWAWSNRSSGEDQVAVAHCSLCGHTSHLGYGVTPLDDQARRLPKHP